MENLLLAPAQHLMQRVEDDVPPQTAMRAMDRDFLDATSAESGRDVAALLAEIMDAVRTAPDGDLVAVPSPKTRIEAAATTVFDRLDDQLPYATIALLTCSVGIGGRRRAERGYETSQLANGIEQVSGERRALRLKEFAWHVVENVYGPFLHVLLQAVWARDGKPFRPFKSIGDVLNEVKQRNLLGEDLWVDAARVRNAASHNGGWRPCIDRNTVTLHDERKNGEPPWTREFDVDALFGQLLELAAHAQTLEGVFGRAAKRDVVVPFQPGFMELAKTGDARALEQVAHVFGEQYQATWSSLQERGWPQAE